MKHMNYKISADNEYEPYQLFEFEKTENCLEIKRYLQRDNERITELEIPSRFRSLTVKSIAARAFADAKYLHSVTVPETVTVIERGAFENCTSLAEISLPDKLKVANGNMFKDCRSLRRVVLPAEADIIRPYTFYKCSGLEEVVLPKTSCILHSKAFCECPNLSGIVFPEKGKVTLLGSVFENCPLLPAEVRMYALIGTNDLDEPFAYNAGFDWSIALRRDVFELAVRHDSFSAIDRFTLFRQLIDNDLPELLPLAEVILDEELAGALADYSAEHGKTEMTARLLNFKNGAVTKSIEQIIDEQFEL